VTSSVDLAVATVGMVVLGAAVFWLMWLGWQRRARRHDIPPLLPVCTDDGSPLLSAQGRYVGSTWAGDWLDPVAAIESLTREHRR
jgi:hypothetical protein